MSRILISYRRSDSADATGRIYDQLCRRFGKRNVFKDVDSIPLGVDFIKTITSTIQHCDAVLAIIGNQWLGVMNAEGKSRIHDPEDVVRVELETALKSKVKVIPVLVQGTQMPKEHELPDALKPICNLNAATVRAGRDFPEDMEGLYRAIRIPGVNRYRLSLIIAASLLCLAVIWFSHLIPGLGIPSAIKSETQKKLLSPYADDVIIGTVEVHIPYGYFMEATDRKKPGRILYASAEPRSREPGKPNPHGQDVVLSFDLTSRSQLQLRITRLFVEVLEYIPIQNVKTDPAKSAGETKRYFCNLKPAAGIYNAVQLDTAYDFLKLSFGELEHFEVSVNAEKAGIFRVRVGVEYEIAGKKWSSIGPEVDELIGFFDVNKYYWMRN